MIRVSKEINKIKALVVENYINGEIKTYYNKNEFQTIIDNNDKMAVTKIFELTKENKDYIILKLISNMDINDSNKMECNINNLDMFAKILPITTDIPYDWDVEEDREELMELVNNPTEFMSIVQSVIYNMIKNVFCDVVKNIISTNDIPKEIKEIINNRDEINKLEIEKEDNEYNK